MARDLKQIDNFNYSPNNPIILTVTNSTVSGNHAGDGGGLYSVDAMTVTNSTIADNSATRSGGGIVGAISIADTIVAGNRVSSGGSNPDCAGTPRSLGYNLLGTGAGCSAFVDNVNGDLVGTAGSPVDARLGPLQDNGGPTLTHALLPGSPAIDAGNPDGCRDDKGNLLTTDQRGAPRPDAAGAWCDIGAYEYDTAAATPIATPTVTPMAPIMATPTVTVTIHPRPSHGRSQGTIVVRVPAHAQVIVDVAHLPSRQRVVVARADRPVLVVRAPFR